jgi:hypothetical protein
MVKLLTQIITYYLFINNIFKYKFIFNLSLGIIKDNNKIVLSESLIAAATINGKVLFESIVDYSYDHNLIFDYDTIFYIQIDNYKDSFIFNNIIYII